MRKVSGHVFTHDAHAAHHFRHMFYDYLVIKHSDIELYWEWEDWEDEDSNEGDYTFYFKAVPAELFQKFASLWIGQDAIYPYRVGGSFYTRDYSQEAA